METLMKNKINIKHTLMGLGMATTVIAPVTTLVACGGRLNQENLKPLDENNTPANSIVMKSNISVPTIDKYTDTSLRADATKFADDSVWIQGLAQESLQQTISFIRSFARTLGYDREKDFFQKNDGNFRYNLTDADLLATPDLVEQKFETMQSFKNARITASEAKYNIGILQKFKNRTLQDGNKYYANLASGKDKADGDQPYTIGVDWDASIGQRSDNPTGKIWHDQNHLTDGVNYVDDIMWGGHWVDTSNDDWKNNPHAEAILNKLSAWADYKNPGQEIVEITSSKKVSRTFVIPNGIQKYSVLDETTLENDFLPYAKGLINAFVSLYLSNQRLANSGFSYIQSDFKDLLDFIIKKFTSTDTKTGEQLFEIDDATFLKSVKEINNGSHHLLAIKAFYAGYDKSLTQGDYAFDIEGGFAGRWSAGKDLNGFYGLYADKTNISKGIMGITDWLYSGQDLPYNATKTFVQMHKDQIIFYLTSRKIEVTELIKTHSNNFVDIVSMPQAWGIVRKAETILNHPTVFTDRDASWAKTQEELEAQIAIKPIA